MKFKNLLVVVVTVILLPFISHGQEDGRLFERMALDGDKMAQIVMGLSCTNLVQSYAWLCVATYENPFFDMQAFQTGSEKAAVETAKRFKRKFEDGMSQKQIYDEGRDLTQKIAEEINQNQIAVLRKAEAEGFVSRAGERSCARLG
jgi:hypothetical protein